MTVHTALRIGLLACMACCLGAFGTAESQPVLLAMFATAAAGGWWVTEWRPSRAGTGNAAWRGLPRWLTNVFLVVVVIVAGVSAWDGRGLITTFATLLASVLVIKLWQKRNPADYAQLLTMSLFLTIAAVLTDNSVSTGAFVLLQTPALVVSAMLYQVYLAGAQGRASAEPELAKAAARRAWVRVRVPLTLVCLGVIAMGSLIACAVFIFMPRGYPFHQFPAFARPTVGRQVGFTDEIDLAAGAPTEDSGIVVMEAQLLREQQVVGSIDQPIYLRGAVLDHYSAGRWSTSRRLVSVSKPDRAFGPDYVSEYSFIREGASVNGHTKVQPKIGGRGQTPAFSVGEGYRWEFESNVDAAIDTRFGTLLYTPRGNRPGYQVTTTFSTRMNETSLRGAVSFPEAAVREYAWRVLQEAGIEPDAARRDPSADSLAVRALEVHLRTNFTYSTDASPPPVHEPVTWFLETERRGHCEFFASALAAMCRSIGVDANVIAGYLTSEYNPEGWSDARGAYTVRAHDAHAWVEANVEPGVWRTFDGTPEADPGFRDQQKTGIAAYFDNLLFALEDLWNTRIVSYDRASQERLLGLSDRPGGFASAITSLLEPRGRRESESGVQAGRRTILIALVTIVGAALAGWGLVALRRTRREPRPLAPGWAAAASTPEARQLAAEVARALAARKIERDPGVPLGRLADGLTSADEFSAALRAASAALYEACFAGREQAEPLRAARVRLRRAT